ncbi:proline dehydrogenase family protein [Nonomuraea soli]|uniref:proline dehydrogenase n=1 Tax=Nonomuraea soli TaxID=1032476 RepID=A0A7W0HQ58_9ACTN|nr:proline dehydrogenase family protein [Nonomuraea soli]MBA2891296.1 proline dehydrogenase [Nonomuraea soli]
MLLRQTLIAVSRSRRAEALLSNSSMTTSVARRFVASDVIAATSELTRRGLLVTVDHLGEEVDDRVKADGEVMAYVDVIGRLAPGADVSVKLTALGLRLSEQLALDNAATICEAAAARDVTVTLDAEEHDTIDALMSVHATLRKEHPLVGVAVQAYLKDAAERCAALTGARVRLCKGAYDAPGAYSGKDVDRSFVKCLRVLMSGSAYPMVASHDPRMIEIASTLAVLHGRDADGFEYQMLYGVRTDEQARLAGLGAKVRVYVPYGDDWYAYLMRRLAERPANLRFVARALVSGR